MIKRITLLCLLITSLVACKSKYDIDVFLDSRPKLFLPLDISNVDISEESRSNGWTEEEQKMMKMLFSGCDSIWSFEEDEYFPITEIYQLKPIGDLRVLLMVSYSYTQGVGVKKIIATMDDSYGIRDIKPLEWYNEIITPEFARTAQSKIDSAYNITVTERLFKRVETDQILTHATYRIDTVGKFQEVQEKGMRAVRHKELINRYGYLIEDFTWGDASIDPLQEPNKENKQNVFLDYESDASIMRHLPYYQGELYAAVEKQRDYKNEDIIYYVDQSYEYDLSDKRKFGVWCISSTYDYDAPVQQLLMAYVAQGDTLQVVDYTVSLPEKSKNYYAATLDNNKITMNGVSNTITIRATKRNIFVDSLMFYNRTIDNLNNAELTVAPIGRKILSGKKLGDLNESFIKSLHYNFQPLKKLNPSYNIWEDSRYRMEKYYKSINSSELPCLLYLGGNKTELSDNQECLPESLASFFTSNCGMGERTNFYLLKLTSRYIMRPMMIVNCNYKGSMESYLYVLDDNMNIKGHLFIGSINRDSESYYEINIEATAVNNFTIASTPHNLSDKSLEVRSFNIQQDGTLVEQ